VTFHLQNAAQKMGVVNRQQAISRALSMGLIVPLLSSFSDAEF
jgi:DNA-binding CsgD family transcriptional regulator